MPTEIEKLEEQFTKYEIARILGARALQIAMDAPLLLKIDEKDLESFHYNPIEIAKRELVAKVLPITINRPMPNKKESKIKTVSKEEIESIKRKEKEEEAQKEIEAEKELEAKTNKEAPKDAAEAKEDEVLEHVEQGEQKKVAEDDEIMELSTPEDEEEVVEAVAETED